MTPPTAFAPVLISDLNNTSMRGGPGVSGLTSLVENADSLLNRTGGAYDFVSWDPRGVGPYT